MVAMVNYTRRDDFIGHYPKVSKHRYSKSPLTDFISYVAIPNHKAFYAQYYTGDTKVKPFFDYDHDIYDKDLSSHRFKEMIASTKERLLRDIHQEFYSDECPHYIVALADNSRWYGRKQCFRVSFQIVVNNGSYALVHDLEKISAKLKCDVSVHRSKFRVLRFANQYKDKNQKRKPRLYYYDENQKEVMGSLHHFVIFSASDIEHISEIPSVVIQNKKQKYKRGQCKIQPIPDAEHEDPPSIYQYELLRTLLDDLPEEYYTVYDKWVRVGMAIFNYCGRTNEGLECWVTFSEKSERHRAESRSECLKRWNLFQPHHNPVTIATFIKVHMKLTTPKQNVHYSKLYRPIRYEPFSGIEKLKQIDVMNIKSQYLTNRDGTPVECIKDDVLRRKYLFICSPTGTGKTTLIKHLIKEHDVISIVSRRSLASYHHNTMDGILYHYDEDEGEQHTLNKVFQLDSLRTKFTENGAPFNFDSSEIIYRDYVVILDEYNSLINHLFNYMPNMRKHRIQIACNLLQVIENATFVLCFDANLSLSTIQWLYDNVNTKVERPLLIINKPEIRLPQTVTFYKRYSRAVQCMLKDIKDGIYFFCCSDRCEKYFLEVVSKLVDFTKISESERKGIAKFFDRKKDESNGEGVYLELDKVVIYCGRLSTKIDTDDWKNKWVFCTPTIQYGMDYSLPNTHKVYSINFSGTLDATGIYQQLSRIRTPISIGCYIQDNPMLHRETWREYLDGWQDIDLKSDVAHTTIREIISVSDGFLESLNRLHQRHDFTHKFLSMHMEYHLTNFLKEKGYHKFRCDKRKPIRKSKKDVRLDVILRKLGITDEKHKGLLLAMFQEKKLKKYCDVRYKERHDSMWLYQNLCYYDKLVRQFQYIHYLGKETFTLDKINDTEVQKVLDPLQRILLIRDVMAQVGITNLSDVSLDVVTDANNRGVLLDKCQCATIAKTFRLKNVSTVPIGNLLGKMLKNVIPDFVKNHEMKVKVNGKRTSRRFKYIDPNIRMLEGIQQWGDIFVDDD